MNSVVTSNRKQFDVGTFLSKYHKSSYIACDGNYSVQLNLNYTLHNVFVTVDDHFAKALGETWVKLQGQTSSSASSNTLITKEKKSSASSTATVSVSVAKETASSSATTPATTLLQQRRGLVSI
jgi:hypothetical protein